MRLPQVASDWNLLYRYRIAHTLSGASINYLYTIERYPRSEDTDHYFDWFIPSKVSDAFK